jgi:hypothetical protein
VTSSGQPLAAVVVADSTGTVYEVALAGAEHQLPDPEEIRSWLQFVSYQCPECWSDGPVWGRQS